jgi:hypothetical protein
MIRLLLLVALLYFLYRFVRYMVLPLWRIREGLRQHNEEKRRRQTQSRKRRWGDIELDYAPEPKKSRWRPKSDAVEEGRYRDLR